MASAAGGFADGDSGAPMQPDGQQDNGRPRRPIYDRDMLKTEAAKDFTLQELKLVKRQMRIVFVASAVFPLALSTGVFVASSTLMKKKPILPKRLFYAASSFLLAPTVSLPIVVPLMRSFHSGLDDPAHYTEITRRATREAQEARLEARRRAAPMIEQNQGQLPSQTEASPMAGASHNNSANDFKTFSPQTPSQSIGMDGEPAPMVTSMPGAAESDSRWAQLRADQGVQPSTWERIRQQNARDLHNSTSGQPQQDRFAQYPDQPQSRPTPLPAQDFQRASPPPMDAQPTGWGSSEFADDSASNGFNNRAGPGSAQRW